MSINYDDLAIAMQRLNIYFLIILFSCTQNKINTSESYNISSIQNTTPHSNHVQNPTIKNILGHWKSISKAQYSEFEIDSTYFYLLKFSSDFHKNKISDSVASFSFDENIIKLQFLKRKNEGLIEFLKNDTLIIYWASGERIIYLRLY